MKVIFTALLKSRGKNRTNAESKNMTFVGFINGISF